MNIHSCRASSIMIKKVVTVKPDDAIAYAKLRMMRQGIGGLPVVGNDGLVGIITQRDILFAGEGVLGMKVRDIMTLDPVVIKEGTSLLDIVAIMRKKGYQRIPVVKGKKLVGIVTQSSVITVLAN